MGCRCCELAVICFQGLASVTNRERGRLPLGTVASISLEKNLVHREVDEAKAGIPQSKKTSPKTTPLIEARLCRLDTNPSGVR